MRIKFDLVSQPRCKQVDNQIKSIKSSDALAKEGITATNPPYGMRIGMCKGVTPFSFSKPPHPRTDTRVVKV